MILGISLSHRQQQIPDSLPRESYSLLPNLYPVVEWEATRSGMIRARSGSGQVLELESYRNESELLRDPPISDFFAYYHRELTSRGWSFSSGAAADGPGEQRGYERDGRFFLLGYNLVLEGEPPSRPTGFRLFVQHN